MWPDMKVMLVTLVPITSTRYITPTVILILNLRDGTYIGRHTTIHIRQIKMD